MENDQQWRRTDNWHRWTFEFDAQFRMSDIKFEYHYNENPLKYSEINSICLSKVNV